MNYLHKPIETGLECGWACDLRFQIAAELLRQASIIGAIPDGEDSSGRQKLRLQTPDEIATRAIEIAAALVEKAEQCGWIFAYDKEQATDLLTEVKKAQGAADNESWDFRRALKKKDEEPA